MRTHYVIQARCVKTSHGYMVQLVKGGLCFAPSQPRAAARRDMKRLNRMITETVY